jgi:hypothetical protein
LSGNALLNSNTQKKNYFEENLLFKDGLSTIVRGKPILQWIEYGAEMEDQPMCRASNHFHNPYLPWTESGLTDTVTTVNGYCSAAGLGQYSPSQITSNVTWATGFGSKDAAELTISVAERNFWDWESARRYYYAFLTGLDLETNTVIAPGEVMQLLSSTQAFQALGQIMHLLQDTAVPAHVRNDFSQGHLMYRTEQEGMPWTWIGNGFEQYVKRNNDAPWFDDIPVRGAFSSMRLTDLWDTDQLVKGNSLPEIVSIGLSEYTNMNFFSEFTMFTDDFANPRKQDCIIILDTLPHNPNFPLLRKYFSYTSGESGESVEHLATAGFLYYWRETYFPKTIDEMTPKGLDDNCYQDYAAKLIPRAIGYSAQLLDYFFRGTIAISPPDEFIYSVIDGSADQSFQYIKTKLQNTTPNEEMLSGTLVAVARYKRRTDYVADLSSNEPPSTASREKYYDYSVSAPVEIQELTSDPGQAEPFTFDFSSNPIPAGITDLTLQVIFKGTLGHETDTAIAVGTLDLAEPRHIAVWNLTDLFYLKGGLMTADEIQANDQLLDYLKRNCEHLLPYLNPFPMDTSIGFSASRTISPIHIVSYPALTPGKFGRIIVLSDHSSLSIHVNRTSAMPAFNQTNILTYAPITNQEDNSGFINTPVTTFREITSHNFTGYLFYCPTMSGLGIDDFPAVADNQPIPATIAFP